MSYRFEPLARDGDAETADPQEVSVRARTALRSAYWTEWEPCSRMAPATSHALWNTPPVRFAVKCHPVSRYPADWRFDGRVVRAEIRLLRRCSRAVERGGVPNLPMHYDAFAGPTRCEERFDVRGPDLPKWSFYTCNEYAPGGDLEHWQRQGGPHTPAEWESCFAQILLGAAAFNSESVTGGWVHGDMHWGNVIMHPLRPGGCWHYRLIYGGETIQLYVPNAGQQWRLWDFGYATPIRSAADVLETLRDVDNVLGGCFEFARRDGTYAAPKIFLPTRNLIRPKAMTRKRFDSFVRRIRKRFEKVYSASRKVPSVNLPLEVFREMQWLGMDEPTSRVLNRGNPYTLRAGYESLASAEDS